MQHDFHTHSTYSDGSFIDWMVRKAAEIGLDGIGISDHATVSDRPAMRDHRRRSGYNLDLTYERRRDVIDGLRSEYDIAVYDAVEIDYDPRDEAAISAFLDAAEFDYALGSVHFVDGVNVHRPGPFRDRSRAERRRLVEGYFDDLESLIRSELFDIAAHPDIVERNEALRGLAGPDQYERIAEAFAASETIAEINAGRVTNDYGEFHPRPAFLETLLAADCRLTVGTDAHHPSQLDDRVDALEDAIDRYGIEPASPFGRLEA